MTRRNPPARWVLPTVIDPPTSTCWSVPVPDDPFHRAAFLGALATLGSALGWADDPDHKAKAVAQVWRNIADNLNKCTPGEIITRNYEDENPMPIRVDCDCNIWVLCCDGTEKQIFTAQQVKDTIAGGATAGAPQPEPNGGCASYAGNLVNGGRFLVPTPMSTGDVITLGSISGSSNGSSYAGWQCPNGNQFFAGACVPYTHFDASALLPSAPIGELLILISGNYYPGNSPLTVPSGISNVQPEIVLNYPATDTIAGTVGFSVEVCNNGVGEYAHTFDFSTGTHGWLVNSNGGARGVWTAGAGWQDTDVSGGGGCFRGVNIYRPLTTTAHIASVELVFALVVGAFGLSDDALLFGHDVSVSSWDVQKPPSDFASGGPNFDKAYTGLSVTAPSNLTCIMNVDKEGGCGSLTGYVTLKKIIVRGPGADPF